MVYVYVYMYIHVHVHVYVFWHVYVYVYVHVYVRVHMHVYVYVYALYACAWVGLCMYKRVYIHACMCEPMWRRESADKSLHVLRRLR